MPSCEGILICSSETAAFIIDFYTCPLARAFEPDYIKLYYKTNFYTCPLARAFLYVQQKNKSRRLFLYMPSCEGIRSCVRSLSLFPDFYTCPLARAFLYSHDYTLTTHFYTCPLARAFDHRPRKHSSLLNFYPCPLARAFFTLRRLAARIRNFYTCPLARAFSKHC